MAYIYIYLAQCEGCQCKSSWVLMHWVESCDGKDDPNESDDDARMVRFDNSKDVWPLHWMVNLKSLKLIGPKMVQTKLK